MLNIRAASYTYDKKHLCFFYGVVMQNDTITKIPLTDETKQGINIVHNQSGKFLEFRADKIDISAPLQNDNDLTELLEV